ncbi:MAG: HK97 family phage prohead protease [Bacillota bacterium]
MNEIETRHCEHYEAREGLEVRLTPAAGDQPNKLIGYAAVFNSLSADLGGWKERIIPGAFKTSLSNGQDIRALVDHDFSKLLGRSSNTTLKLAEDATGLRVEIDVPDTSYGHDVLASVKRGDIKGMSFGFRVLPDGERFTKDVAKDGTEILVRELTNLDLKEVTVTSIPAYSATSVQCRVDPGVVERFQATQPRPELAKRWMQYRKIVAAE